MFCTETENLKARKIHICHSCGERINPGDQYLRWRSYDDGDVGTNKMHPECYNAHVQDAKGQSWEYTLFSYPRGKVE